MAVRPGGHEFVLGEGTAHGRDGRTYRLCAECGLPRRSAPHQPVDPRTLRHAPHVTPVLLPAREPEPREVAMLRLAIDAALDLTSLGWTLRQRLVAARQAIDLPPDTRPAPVTPAGAEPTRTTRASRKGTARWVRRSIRGQYWPIAEAALDQGFEPHRTGNGHVRFVRGSQAFSLTTTDSAGHARGFENAKAAAKRAGVSL